MGLHYDNEHCRIAAAMLGTKAELLDCRLIEYLNSIAQLVETFRASVDYWDLEGRFNSRHAIAVAIMNWKEK